MATPAESNRKSARFTLGLLLLAALFSASGCNMLHGADIVDLAGPGAVETSLRVATEPASAVARASGLDVTYDSELDGDLSIEVLDADGTVVASRTAAQTQIDLVAGTYRLRIIEEGSPIATGDGGISAAVAVMSDPFDHDGSSTTLVCDPTGCTLG